MKKLTITIILTLFIITSAIATNNSHRGHYVSVAHLHNIFEQVKRNSNVSQKALADTFAYYEKNCYKKRLSPKYLAIADYTKLGIHKRLYIINLDNGKVTKYFVAHGLNSGPRKGRVIRASNNPGSYQTPIGFFKIGNKEGITIKKRYKYLSVHGLEKRNSNAHKRQILLHTAPYVAKGGRSLGCFAINPKDKKEIFSKLKNALIYSYVGI